MLTFDFTLHKSRFITLHQTGTANLLFDPSKFASLLKFRPIILYEYQIQLKLRGKPAGPGYLIAVTSCELNGGEAKATVSSTIYLHTVNPLYGQEVERTSQHAG